MRLALFVAILMAATAAGATDNVLLIQLQPGGRYVVWHTEGESRISDDEVMALEATAKPEGGEEMPTSAGPARAYETSDGVTIRLLSAKNDKALLLDRDDCNHVRIWHAAGATNLSEDQITDIFMSALPEGGKRITIGKYYVKAFITKLGVTASLWNAPAR
ncbi:MAG: hypothetical protein FD157_1792 [Rhodocyclaceae bacterium]|nr:MAG: hypothetical protein FD157_1792 [Rhodocyclaceae bacterium]TND01180.1 MAG: hypothetical protein FD118_2565 [Rhodocyclaceae bacterium]